ncbi:unnamed protein product [Microthlaspi erraticum]|uniref:Uncharacterized protein n=1 Tax=Microthlaspi erraticum TaxID=1685480 RepID=A0A6D2I5F3_9BRAS|nr:unnamed protein product [Microthlaspi erraticum]CAA7045434.1 unnamed protein product [Microthlaspi erraticum]
MLFCLYTERNVGRKVPGYSRGSNSCSPPVFPLRSITELLQVPARQDQPTLHPEKKDRALWISIDNEVKYDIKRAFTNDFDGLWWNFGEVWQEPQDKWWSDLVMDNYDPIDPPVVVLLSQARYERDLLNWTGAVNLMSQQLLIASIDPSPSSPLSTNVQMNIV